MIKNRFSEKEKRSLLRKTAVAFLMFAVAVALELLAKYCDGFADWYVKTIYPVLVNTIGRLCNLFPISVVELLLYAVVILIVLGFLDCILTGLIKRSFLKKLILYLNNVILVLSVIAMTYMTGCGVNYRAASWSEEQGYTTGSYTEEDLRKLCEYLTEEINGRMDSLSYDAGGALIPESFDAMEQEARVCMTRMGEEYDTLSGYYPTPKGVRISRILTVCLITGVYSPFTVEANYNMETPNYELPMTICHELSHLKGFMREDEANFIAILACLKSDDTMFQFSGLMLGYSYCMNAYYKSVENKDSYYALRGELDERASKELTDGSAFWNRFKGKASETHSKVNDAYLKANGQSAGQKTYSHVVNLLLAWHQSM